MPYRNDPDLGAIPVVGTDSVDIAKRTTCGEAVRFGGDLDKLVEWLGSDQFVTVNGVLYQRTDEGKLAPLPVLAVGTVIVKPPAGDWFTLTEAQLKSEYAIVVNLAPALKAHVAPVTATKKAAAPKKAATKKAAATKK